MTISVIIFIFLAIIHSAASSVCSYTYARVLSWKYCTYGCCSQYSYDPCCDAPFYTGAVFIAPVAVGSVMFLFCLIAAIVCARRRRTLTTIHYGAPMVATQVATNNTAANSYGAYSNPQFQGPPPYATEAPRY